MTLESEIKLVQRLVRMMEKGDVSELELEDAKGGMRVHIKRGQQPVAGATPVVHLSHASPGGESSPPAAAAAGAPAQAGTAAPASTGTPFLSPMVGTFYRAASPDADPFVSVGTDIDDDTVVCIIEAMKVMNEIKAETRGRIVEILVENGEPIEYGQPLFMLEPA